MNDLVNNLNFILGGGGIISLLAVVYSIGKFHNRFEKLELSYNDLRSEMKSEFKEFRSEYKNDLRELKSDIKEMIHELKIDIEDMKRKKVG